MIVEPSNPINVRQLNAFCLVLDQHFPADQTVSFADVEQAVSKHFDVGAVVQSMFLKAVQERKLYAAAVARFNWCRRGTLERLEDREYKLYVGKNEPAVLDLEGVEVDPTLNAEEVRGGGYINMQAIDKGKRIQIAARGLIQPGWLYLAGKYFGNLCVIGILVKPKSS